MTHGVWSEVSLERDRGKVFGKCVVQALEETNQSSLSKRWFICLLVQVNLYPLRGISVILNLLMDSLNWSISCILLPVLFLLAGHRIKLKSLTISHLTSSGVLIPLNQLRNSCLPSRVQGAYTLVRIQFSLDNKHWNSTDWAYPFVKIKLPTKLELFQRMMLPPEAPAQERNLKKSIWAGQKFLINWVSKDSLLVSCKQIISHLDTRILLLMVFHLSSELITLMF